MTKSVVWKYPLNVVGEQKFMVPGAWNPIHVDYQDGRLTLWAEVDVLRIDAMVSRTITIVGTGHSFDSEGLVYIGSALDPARPLVWHVYHDGS